MNFIKKIVDGQIDGSVHIQFQKFSRGEFPNKAIINFKASAGKYTINTSAEFVNDLVRDVAKKLGEGKTKVTGAIVSTLNLKEEPVFSSLLAHAQVKQFQGVKRYLVDSEISGTQIIEYLDKEPKAFFALSFEAGETKLKIKPKAPKSGKPGAKGEGAPKADFCKLVTKEKSFAQEFVFENPGCKTAEINHTIKVEEIVVPEELKSSKDFAKIREESKRKGKIIRKSKIDGVESTKEIDFEA